MHRLSEGSETTHTPLMSESPCAHDSQSHVSSHYGFVVTLSSQRSSHIQQWLSVSRRRSRANCSHHVTRTKREPRRKRATYTPHASDGARRQSRLRHRLSDVSASRTGVAGGLVLQGEGIDGAATRTTSGTVDTRKACGKRWRPERKKHQDS